MQRTYVHKLKSMPFIVCLLITGTLFVQAQYNLNKTRASTQQVKLSLAATLIDEVKYAQQKAATVFVRVSGVRITDPSDANDQPIAGQAHLHYQVDNGPVIATTEMKLSFLELTSGPHKIVVSLAGNDNNPLGPQETLEVTIP